MGQMLSNMLPSSLSPLLGAEVDSRLQQANADGKRQGVVVQDDDDDLWFTDLEDFNPPIIILEETKLRTTYFVKASVCKRNFVMHEYLKGGLSF